MLGVQTDELKFFNNPHLLTKQREANGLSGLFTR